MYDKYGYGQIMEPYRIDGDNKIYIYIYCNIAIKEKNNDMKN